MVFAEHQHESAVGIHMSPPSWTYLPPPSPSHPSRLSQSTGFGIPMSYSKFPLAISFTYGNVCVSVLFSQSSHPLLPREGVSRSMFFMSASPSERAVLLPLTWPLKGHCRVIHWPNFSIAVTQGIGRPLRVPWTARRSNQSILREISPGCSLEGLMLKLKLKLQYFGHLMRRVDSLKDPDAGRDWGQEEKGTTEDEMAGWHHWLDGHEFGWTPGVGDGQGGLACCDSWGHKELDTTEWLNWTELEEREKDWERPVGGAVRMHTTFIKFTVLQWVWFVVTQTSYNCNIKDRWS